MFKGLIRSIADGMPSQCAVCRAWPAQPLCTACVARFAPTQARCATCALPVAGGTTSCIDCLRTAPALDACLAAVAYAFPWSGLVTRFKFHGQPAWASSLGGMLRNVPGVQAALESATWVLPMPISSARLRVRGFNQAFELCRQLAPAKADAGLLLRIQDTPPQTALTRAQRVRNVRHAFAVEPLRTQLLRSAQVVLVDDVMTSGASMTAAAQTLRGAGARRVTGVVFARAERAAADAEPIPLATAG